MFINFALGLIGIAVEIDWPCSTSTARVTMQRAARAVEQVYFVESLVVYQGIYLAG